jgi:quercetin dioxygenase-like cupin family protein
MPHFIALNKLAAIPATEGILLSTVQTENLTLAYSSMKAGAAVPLHQHTEEAVDIIIEGVLEMQVGEKSDTLSHGMISIVPSGVAHKATAITDCKVLTIFYPQRSL